MQPLVLVLSLEQQWSTYNVEILHRAQMGQDVYIRNTHVPNIPTYIYIYIYIYRQFSIFTTSVGLAALAPTRGMQCIVGRA